MYDVLDFSDKEIRMIARRRAEKNVKLFSRYMALRIFVAFILGLIGSAVMMYLDSVWRILTLVLPIFGALYVIWPLDRARMRYRKEEFQRMRAHMHQLRALLNISLRDQD